MTIMIKGVIDRLKDREIPITVADPDRPDCPIVYCNPAFENLTGYSRSEVTGKNCRFLQGPATNREDITQLKSAIDTRSDIAICLFNYHRDGSPFHNFLIVRSFELGDKTYLIGCQHHFKEFNGFDAFELHNQRVTGVMNEELLASDVFQDAHTKTMNLRANTLQTQLKLYLNSAAEAGRLQLSA